MKNTAFLLFNFLFCWSLLAQNDIQPKPEQKAPTINIGKPASFELQNGLKVMVVENHKLPRVSYNLFIDNAPNLEGSKKGVSNLTSSLMGSGTQKTSKTAFNEEIDFLGANINFSSTSASATGLSKYSKRILELLAEGCLNTVFTQAEFDKERTKLLESLKATEKSVATVSRRLENVLSYGKNHPYGEYLSESSLNTITLDDVNTYYNTYFVPENAYLVVIGDVKFEEIKSQIETQFGPWQKAVAPNLTYSNNKDVQYTQINFVDMPNAVQSEISLLNLSTLKMTDKDYFPVIVANYILGGDYNGYLMSNLRENHAWTYDTGSNLNANKYISRFISYAEVRNSVTDSAVVQMVQEIKRIRTEKVAEDALKNAKASYVGQFVMEIEKPQTVAGYALRIKTQGLPEDFYEKYIQNINAVTPEDILRVANKYFLVDQARIIIVGKGSDVLPAIENLKIPIFYFDKYGNPTEKPVYKRALPAGITAKTVVQNYIKAIGGEAVLKNVKTLYTVSSGTIQGAPIELTSKVSSSHQQFRDVKVMGMSIMQQMVNKKGAFLVQQGQRKEVTGEELAILKASAVPFEELDLQDTTSLVLDGIEKYNDADVYVLKEGKRAFYYDVKSSLKVAEVVAMDVNSQQISQTTSFSDYREVKGIKIPYVTTTNIGMEILLTTTDVKINEGVSDADFQ